MKRLISVLVMVMFMTGMVVAQSNISTTTQNGDDNDATVTQTGNMNESVISQMSDENMSTVEQDGAKNYSDIKQATMGDAYVNQIGKENESRLNQAGLNEADVFQNGNNNKVGSYYDIDGYAKQKNGVGIFQTDKNYLDIEQIGNTNNAGVTQRHHADAELDQEGENNEIKLFQSGAPEGMMNIANLKQIGDDNSFEVFQYGDGNEASVEFTKAGNGAESSNNIVDLTQGSETPWNKSGDNNYFQLKANRSNGNTVTADQIGDDNYHKITIEGDNNSLVLNAEGNANRGDWSIAEPVWPAKSNNNSLTITQDGNLNYATGSIAGDNNVVDILQEGSSNLVGTDWHKEDGVAIDGNNNTVDIIQKGVGNQSLNTVTGSGNSINVVQQP